MISCDHSALHTAETSLNIAHSSTGWVETSVCMDSLILRKVGNKWQDTTLAVRPDHSPRITALYQMLELSPIFTSPMTFAPGAMKTFVPLRGRITSVREAMPWDGAGTAITEPMVGGERGSSLTGAHARFGCTAQVYESV